jgi:hypothetical protein
MVEETLLEKKRSRWFVVGSGGKNLFFTLKT